MTKWYIISLKANLIDNKDNKMGATPQQNKAKLFWQRVRRFFGSLGEMARTLSAILALLTILGISSAIIGILRDNAGLIVVGVLIVVIGVLLVIGLYTLLRKEKEEKGRLEAGAPGLHSKYPDPDPGDAADIELILKEIVYQYFEDGQKMRMRRRFVIRALRDGVPHFTDRYRWTSTGKCVVKSLTPSCTVVNARKDEFWEYFDVAFPHPLRSGQTQDFTIEWDLFDEKKEAVPFLSTSIDLRTERLKMEVILPHSLAPKKAYANIFDNYLKTLPQETEELHWNPATETITFEVQNPKKFYKYLINWYY